MPKISIIVPVYNVEKYIAQCLDSIIKQTFRGY
ncbi:MAG: glycosyltransferase [Enterocloster sp.]